MLIFPPKVIPTPLSPRTNAPSTDTTTKSTNNTNIKLDGTEFIPKVTTRYPTKDYDENPLLVDSVTAFCYPSGKVPVGTFYLFCDCLIDCVV